MSRHALETKSWRSLTSCSYQDRSKEEKSAEKFVSHYRLTIGFGKKRGQSDSCMYDSESRDYAMEARYLETLPLKIVCDERMDGPNGI